MKLLIIALMTLVCIVITQSTDNRTYIKVGQFWMDGDYERQKQGLPSTFLFLTEAMHNTAVANAKLWRDYQNIKGINNFNGQTVYINLTLYNIGGYTSYYGTDTLSNISKAVNAVMDRENDTMFFFGLVGTAWTLEVVKAAVTHKRIVLGTISTDKYLPQCQLSEVKVNSTTGASYNALPDECKAVGDRRFRNYFQLGMYNDFWPNDGLNKIHADVKLKKVAIFSVAGEAFATAQYNAAINFFKSNNITVVGDYKINPVSNVDVPGAQKIMDTLLPKIQQFHTSTDMNDWPDLVFGGGNEYVCTAFSAAANRAKFAPKSLMMYCSNGAVQNDYIVSYSNFECFLKGTQFFDIDFNISTQEYCDKLAHDYKETNTVGAGTFKAGKVVASVISRAVDLTNYESVLYDVQATSIITVAGPVQFDSYGALIAVPTIVSQWYEGNRNLLSPVANANHSLIYPMPLYSERIENLVDYQESEKIIFSFTGIALAFNIAVAVAVLVLYTQRSHIISAATPEFLFIMLGGNTLCLISIYFWNISVHDISFCYLRVLFVSVGFIGLFGALIIKTWRIAYLFSDVSMNIKSVSTKQLLLILVLFIAIDAIFLVGLLAGASFTIQKKVLDPFRPAFNYLSCEYPDGKAAVGTVFTWILVGYKIVLVLAGVVCSLMIRKVKYLHLNESKWIGFAMYNLTIVFVPVLIISIVDVSNEVRFIVRSVFIIFISISTNALIFLPKFYYRMRGKDQSKRLMHSGTSNNQISKKSNKSSSSIRNISELEDIEEIEKYLQNNTNMKKLEKGLNKARELIKMYSEFTKSFEKIENRFIEKIIHLQNRKN